jgi:hypothetical protein
MPIVAPAITSAILAAGASSGIVGPNFQLLASSVGRAVSVWARIPSSVVLTGAVTGAVGGGQVSGKLFVVPSPIPLPATIAGVGFLGVQAPLLGGAIGIGVSTSLNAIAGYRGVSTGAIGVDASKVIFADPTSLISLLTGGMTGVGLVGPQAPLLAAGIANGIAAMLLTGVGVGVAAGAAGPSPGVGVSRSSLF